MAENTVRKLKLKKRSDLEVEYKILRSKRVKYAKMVVEADGTICLKIPQGLANPEKMVENILTSELEDKLIELIEVQIPEMKRRNQNAITPSNKLKVGIENGKQVTIWGKIYTVRYYLDERPENYLVMDYEFDESNNEFIVSFGLKKSDAGRFDLDAQASRLWEKFLIVETNKAAINLYNSPNIQRFLTANGLRVSKISARIMKRQWGSVTLEKRTIRLNALLTQLPKKYLEHTLCHEIAHLVIGGHNPMFYKYLTQLDPDAAMTREEMKDLVIQTDGSIIHRSH